MKEDEAKGYFENKGYSLLEFSPSEIKLLKEEDKMCMEHFVIKFGNDNDSFLSVYKKDDNNEFLSQINFTVDLTNCGSDIPVLISSLTY